MRRLATGALLLGLGCQPAAAQTLPDYARDLLGEWLVATEDGKPGCRITLRASRAVGGYLATPAPDCASRNPKLAQAAAWDFESGVRLSDAARKLLFHFQEDETTRMKTSYEHPPVAMLVRARPGVDRAPFAPDLLGRWIMRRPNGPSLCEVTLTKGPPKDGEDSFLLKTGTPCDASVTRLRLTSWRVEDFSLAFDGEPDTSLTFEPTAEGFAKSEGGKPLDLVRAP